MKIVIPTNENTSDTTICPSFGRTPYYLYVDTVTGEREFAVNAAASSPGGAGIAAAQSIVDKGVDALLAPRCGENAANVLKAANITLYKTIGDSVQENIDAFKDNRLKELDNIHPGFHGHGG